MKKLLMLFIVMLALTACESKSGKLSHYENPPTPTPPSSERIKEIESNYDVSVNTTFTIIEVDGHLYLSQFRGGIIHLESCPCKTK